MKVTTSKSKNAESFYITKGYINDKGVSTSTIVRKLGTLAELLPEHGPTRDDVMAWARAEAKIETLKYKQEQKSKAVQITFHADRQLDYDCQTLYQGGYLFLQHFYYKLQLEKICRKLRNKHKFEYDINSILSDLIYTRILEPSSKRASFVAASDFLEKPSYALHDVYRALDILGEECDFIQSEVYKNSSFLGKRNKVAFMWGRRKYTNKNILIFLDVDGVLNTTNSRFTKYEVKESIVESLGMLVDMLNKKGYIVKVVLSSTWRLGYDKDYEQCSPQVQNLITKLASVDITIYDKTPIYTDKTRDVEIARYIKEYELKHNDFAYVILDDDTSIFNKDALRDMSFYKVNEKTGLVASDVNGIVKMLKS